MTTDPDTPTLQDAALAYAARGWPIFPLLPRDKRPLTRHGVKDASCDPAQIERWWRAHPDANIGLDCGGAGLVVIDVDERTTEDGGRKTEDERRTTDDRRPTTEADDSRASHLDCPAPTSVSRLPSSVVLPGVPTLTAHTGGGGLHIFYRLPEGASIRNSAGRLAPGVDVRAAGGYVVLAPSMHPGGRRYCWADERAVADLPPSLLQRLTESSTHHSSINNQKSTINNPPSSAYGLAALSAEAGSVRTAAPGTRNQNLNRAAFNLGQLVTQCHLTLAEVVAALTTAAEAAGLHEPEIRQTLASGLSKGMDTPRTSLAKSPGSPPVKSSDVPAVEPSASPVDKPSTGQAGKPARKPDRPRLARLRATQYAVEDDVLVCKIMTTHGLVTRQLCNFQAAITSMLISDDGAQKRRLYTLSGRTEYGRTLPEARIASDEFDGMRWVSNHWGAHAIIAAGFSARDQLSRAILTISQASMQERFVYTHLGWHALEDRRVFLCADDADVTLEVERELEHYRVPSAPATPEAAREAMRASLAFLEIAPPHVTIPLWACMYLAPTNALVMPRFALWLYGVTGSFKSTLAALALNHFGDWTSADLAAWSSTANSLGKLMFLAKDVPFVIDDFAPQSDRRAADRQEATASAIIRDIGNHSGRGRMNADLSLAAVYRPRGLMISTAEQLPDIGSILARILTVEVRSGDVNLDRLKAQQAGRARYGQAMAGYLAWLDAHWDELKRTVPAEADAYSAELRESGRHQRVPEGLGLLHSGFVRALRYAEAVGALTPEQAAQWRASGWQVITGLAQKQSQIVMDERPVLRFLSILGELLTQGKLRLDPLRGEGEPALRSLGAADAELIGWYDDSYIYLLPSASYNRVARFARDEGRHFATKEQALRRAMAEEGLIETEEGHNTMRLSINNRQQRILLLNRAAAEKVWGVL